MKRKETLVSFNIHRRGIVVLVGHLFCKAYTARASFTVLRCRVYQISTTSTSVGVQGVRPHLPRYFPSDPHARRRPPPPCPYWLHKQRSLAIQTLNPPCSLLPSLQSPPLPSLHRLPFETPARNFSLLANNPEEGASG